jgi:hypothetical protein
VLALVNPMPGACNQRQLIAHVAVRQCRLIRLIEFTTVRASEPMFRPALADMACGCTAKSKALSCFIAALTCKVTL